MSQRVIDHEKFEFIAGWDRPLQYHFLVINDVKSNEIVFSNLNLDSPSMTIDEIIMVINGFGIEPEPSFKETLLNDKLQNVGNDKKVFSYEKR